MRWRVCSIIILLLSVAVLRTEAQTLKVAFGLEKPPYIYKQNGQWKGIEVDIISETLRRMGYSFTFESMSSLRLEAEARHGNSYDLVVGVPSGNEGAVFYSEPYIKYDSSVVTLRKSNLKIKGVKDLGSLRVGAWLSAWKDLGTSFESLFAPTMSGRFNKNYREYLHFHELCLAFWQEKIEALVVDRQIFDWFRILLAEREDTSRDVDFFAIFHDSRSAHVAFRNENLRESFNAELNKMRTSGEYAHLLGSRAVKSVASWVNGISSERKEH
ncbi:MAG: transporter substrate-binding domain-containing protein [Bdellovibrio sp.]